MGLLLYGLFAAIIGSAIKPGHPGGDPLLIIMPAGLFIVAVAEWGAIAVARRTTRP